MVGQGPVRTGVTVVHPRGKANSDPVFAAWFTLNGNGEMTGTTWVQESGYLEGPIGITNTHSVGVVRDAIIKWEVTQKNVLQPWWLPVVAETYDGSLNDINGFHVKEEHALSALDPRTGGLPKEGVVGGGTGMICHGFKGGIGTASRKLPRRSKADTRSACWCSATSVRVAICASPACRLARRSRISNRASRTRSDAARLRARRRCDAPAPVRRDLGARRSRDRSSSSSRRTRRCCRTS